MRKALFALFIVFGLLNKTVAQSSKEDLTKELSQLYENSELSGFAVSVINSDTVLYKGWFGFENITEQKPFSTEQRFYIASISKTFIGIGLMKLVEQGTLKLSTPINSVLPFQIVNPYFPDIDITIEHLARHTSSILYGNLEHKSWYLNSELTLSKKMMGKTAYNDFSEWEKNKPINLGEFLKETLSLDGDLYSKNRFSEHKPGKNYEYSNLGAALAAYIIELSTGVEYREYIEELMHKELGFKRGIWRSTTTKELPTSYFQNKLIVPTYLPILYPAGGMMLSCDELSKYLTEMVKGFTGKSDLLNPVSFQIMMTSNNEETNKSGIFWELNDDKIGHNGGNYGVTVFMSFNKVTGIGKIFITNISSYRDDKLLKEMVGVWRKLEDYESILNK